MSFVQVPYFIPKKKKKPILTITTFENWSALEIAMRAEGQLQFCLTIGHPNKRARVEGKNHLTHRSFPERLVSYLSGIGWQLPAYPAKQVWF